MVRARLASEDGFTLAELAVAIAVIAVILSGMLTLQMTGQETYLTGSNQVESQESGRLALQRMITEIRGAGIDPTRATTAVAPVWTKITAASASSFTINNDWNGDGVINNAVSYTVNGTARGEQVTYSLSGTQLRRQESAIDNAPQVVIDGVDALAFTYYDTTHTGACPTCGVIANPAANASSIVGIGVSLRTKPTDQPSTSRGRVWVTLQDEARIRN
jgi:type IV pilus assembly protein PilW